MRLLATALFSFLFDGHALLAQNPANKLTSNEAKEEWILLFDGRSLNGWQGRPTTVPESKGEIRHLLGYFISCEYDAILNLSGLPHFKTLRT